MIHRTPFELNTTIRCVMVAVFIQLMNPMIAYPVFSMFFSLLIESILYAKAFMSDVELLFNEINRMAANEEPETSLLGLFRTTIELHNGAYAYEYSILQLTFYSIH